MVGTCSIGELRRNDRGVALIIVLLVTALLIALIFEFAYATRISLRAAVNFRDNERAYYLARSGISVAGLLLSDLRKKGKSQDYLAKPPEDVSAAVGISDAQLIVGWQDESAKINVSNLTRGSDGYNRIGTLFEIVGINRDRLDQISDWMINERRSLYLVTELHKFLNDEEFGKIQNFVTTTQTNPYNKIDINTASPEVLQCVSLPSGMAQMIYQRQQNGEFFKTDQEITDFLGPQNTRAAAQLTFTSDVFKVDSVVITAGGFTKRLEAIIVRRGDGTGADIKFLQELAVEEL